MYSSEALFTNNLLTILGFWTRSRYKRARCKRSGAYVARKGIPADVKAAHQEHDGRRWETKFRLFGSLRDLSGFGRLQKDGKALCVGLQLAA